MNARENFFRSVKRQNPEYVPMHLTMCDEHIKTLKNISGTDDYEEYFNLPIRQVNLTTTKSTTDFSSYFTSLPPKAYINEWGVGIIPSDEYAHFYRMVHPMADFTTIEEVLSFPLPDILEDYRWEGFEKKVKEIKSKGYVACFSSIMVFEHAWYARGLDNLLADMLVDEEMAKACLDRMMQFQSKIAAKAASMGVDLIIFGDDVGTQKDMMMSVELWRKFIKPTTYSVIKAAKDINPDVLCYYHSDGVIYDIIPELIDIGVDILNPIQPECMDPKLIKELYGDKVTLFGTVGTQTTMPFGSQQEVKENVKSLIENVGQGGGFVIAPTHILEPEVPWENIVAFVEAVNEYGKY
jgi:uroporphyrinogen decarboxylase